MADKERFARDELIDLVLDVREAGLRSSIVMEWGSPSSTIIEVAQNRDVDLILMGTDGRAGLAHLIRGSVAGNVVRRAPCPVLVTGIKKNRIQEVRCRMPSAVKHILVPTDFHEPADYALDYAIAFAHTLQARLTILHVISPSLSTVENLRDRYGGIKKEPSRELPIRLSRVLRSGLQGKSDVVEGSPAQAIIEMAESAEIDLIIMGTHSRIGLKRLLINSVAERVACLAPCPVLVASISAKVTLCCRGNVGSEAEA